MVYLNYMLSELRRRKGRTLLTALGLGVGVAVVITVSALSAGLDRAQAKVLQPLVGVGTDMSVTRPIVVSSGSSNGGPQQLSAKERAQLQKENGDQRVGFGNLKPGQKFTRTSFRSTQLSFSAAQVSTISKLNGVAGAAGGLTLDLTTVSGTVPAQSQQQQGGPPGQGGGGGFNGPRSIDFTSITVSGIDQTKPALAAISASQLTKGTYFGPGSARQAIVNVSYAQAKGVKVGSSINISGKSFTVIGIVKTPLGGQASDVYVKLSQLQSLSGRVGRVNTVYVRATSASVVDAVAKRIDANFSGASVTTAKTLAAQVTGSLASAKNLTGKLGFALELIGLLAAMAIAALLTLSSVTKRVRELGTLKAVGWPQRLVVRQVTGEALLQSLLGAAVGIAVGIGAAVGISAFAPSLTATVASAAQSLGPRGPFGQGAVSSSSASEAVSLTAHVSPALVLAAVGLALLGGLVSGAVGGLRASRLRPADALRHID
ncbi:MAG: ABC transporter permease [Actinomycetota bacterium]|nr:ABC transporter permease [Actinomycetota bacterium]